MAYFQFIKCTISIKLLYTLPYKTTVLYIVRFKELYQSYILKIKSLGDIFCIFRLEYIKNKINNYFQESKELKTFYLNGIK